MNPLVNSFARASRPAFRAAAFRPAFRPQPGARRWATTAAESGSQSWFQRLWDSPVGIKTVHFWAPVMKWAIVLAGISDFARPAEKLSVTQNVALTATGLIWTRWCFVIKPKNYFLAAVNFFLGVVGITQLTRIAMYESSKKKALPAAVEDVKRDIKEAVHS